MMVEGGIVPVIPVILSELLHRPVDELQHHGRTSGLPGLPGLVTVRSEVRLLSLLTASLGPQQVVEVDQSGLVGLLGQDAGAHPASETKHLRSGNTASHRSPSPRLSEVSLEVILEVALISESLRADLALDDQTSPRPALARLERHDI